MLKQSPNNPLSCILCKDHNRSLWQSLGNRMILSEGEKNDDGRKICLQYLKIIIDLSRKRNCVYFLKKI